MMVALAGYILFAVTVRILSLRLSFAEICALRAAGASLVCLLLAAAKPAALSEIRRIYLLPHLLRSALHVAGTLAIVLGLVLVPFGIISALEFTGPIFAAMLVFAIYRAVPTPVSTLGLVIILIGAATMILMQFDELGFVLLLPIAGTFILTCTNMMLRPLVRGASFLVVLLMMNVIQVPIYLAIAVIFPHHGPELSWTTIDTLSAIGLSVSGLVTQLALAKATRYGTDLQISALDTMRIPAVSCVAYLAFAESLGLATIAEIGVIMGGAVVVAVGRLRGLRTIGGWAWRSAAVEPKVETIPIEALTSLAAQVGLPGESGD